MGGCYQSHRLDESHAVGSVSRHCEIPAEIRARIVRNFGILIQRLENRWLFDGSTGIVCCPRHVRMPGNDYLLAVWCFDEIWLNGNFRGEP